MKDYTWETILTALSKEIPQDLISKWIKPLSLKDIHKNIFILNAPNKFVKAWVEDNYVQTIKKVFKEEFSIKSEIEIEIIVEGDAKKETFTAYEPQTETIEDDRDFFSLPLDNLYTFENFVPGHSNNFAYSACMAVASGFKSEYNPLYIYGDIGLGKTHLLQAVGHQLHKNFPKLKILCIQGDLYLQDFTSSLRYEHKLEEFKRKYASIDVLLCDDVQSIAKGPKTQEEFTYLFNKLFATKKHIIITSNTKPSEIANLDKRLSSRFSSGLMVAVQSPSVDEKIAILLKHLEIRRVEMDIDVVHFLANNLNTASVREMLGCLTHLTTSAELSGTDITIDFTTDKLKEFLIVRDKTLSPEKIMSIITDFFHLKPVDLRSKKRSKNIVYPRSIAMFLLREKTQLSLAEVGFLFDRDHSTVLTAVNKISEQEKTDPELQGTLETLRRKMKLDGGGN